MVNLQNLISRCENIVSRSKISLASALLTVISELSCRIVPRPGTRITRVTMTKRVNHDKCSCYCLFKDPKELQENLLYSFVDLKRSVTFLYRILHTRETYRVIDVFATVLNGVSFIRQAQQETFHFHVSVYVCDSADERHATNAYLFTYPIEECQIYIYICRFLFPTSL